MQSVLAGPAGQGQAHLHCCKDLQGQRTQRSVWGSSPTVFLNRFVFSQCVPNFPSSVCVDIEDLDNWHGKPIPKDRVDQLLNDLQSRIQVPNKTLSPEQPKEDTEPADLSEIRLPSPPAYKKGDKVSVGD